MTGCSSTMALLNVHSHDGVRSTTSSRTDLTWSAWDKAARTLPLLRVDEASICEQVLVFKECL